MNLQKNDIVELEITSVTADGSGVGKTEDGIAVFVPLSAVGDKLRVKILKVKKTYAFGKIEEIIAPSKDRNPSVRISISAVDVFTDILIMMRKKELKSRRLRTQ